MPPLYLVVGFLLPSDDTPNAPVVTREAQLDIQSQSQPPTEEQLRAQLVTPQNDPDQVAPVAPEPIQEGQPEEQPQTTHTQPFQPDSGIDNQWRSYRVEPGKTMAQLFRDHGLPATDVYAMAQVEGADKPLSNLQNGQMVKIRQNASGVVTGLTIDTGNNQPGPVYPPAGWQFYSRAVDEGSTKSQLRIVSLMTLRLASSACGETILM